MPFGFSARLGAFYAALCLIIGVQLAFFPVWLSAKGLDAPTIGLVLAVPMIVRIAAVQVTAYIADRRDALRETIIAASVLTVGLYVGLGFADGAAMILIAYALASAAYTPIMPLTETYALKGVAAHGGTYGRPRLWGSVSFIVGVFAAGFFADLMPAVYLIWLVVAATALNAAASFVLTPLHTEPSDQSVLAATPLWRDRVFIAAIAAASLIQASHAIYYGFSAVQWKGEGYDGATIAALWALGVVAEIVLFAYSARLPGPGVLLIAGAAGGVIRWVAMAFDPPAAALPFLQVLHALSFGATHLGSLNLVAQRAGRGRGATAQGHLSIALGLVMAASMSVSGVLYARFGTLSYLAMALAAGAGGACAILAYRAGRHPV